MRFVLAFLLFCGSAFASTEFHRVRVHKDSMYADEDVVVDYDQRYVMNIVSHVHGKGRPSVNLHDLEAGYSAFKDVQNGLCFIEQSNHTIEDFKTALREIPMNGTGYTLKEFQWSCAKEEIPSDQLAELFGERISSFCHDYNSEFVYRTDSPAHRTMRTPDSTSSFICLVCVIALC